MRSRDRVSGQIIGSPWVARPFPIPGNMSRIRAAVRLANASGSFKRRPRVRTAVWLVGVLAALASRTRARDGAPVPGSQGAPTEREQRFIESLRSVTTTAQEDALAKQEIESARTIPRSAVSLWAKGDPEVSASVFAFLSEIGD